MSTLLSPWDPDVEFAIEHSRTRKAVDGYRRNEPKHLVCLACGESVLLTEEPTAGVDYFPHAPRCPQRFARSKWFRERYGRLAGEA